MGWDDELIQSVAHLVAIDDSYRTSLLLDIRDPTAPRVVIPCKDADFAALCRDPQLYEDGVFTWQAIEENTQKFLERGLLAVTMDFEVISFPVPEPML